jgi:hypothetical protein
MVPLVERHPNPTHPTDGFAWDRAEARWEQELPRQLAERWLPHQLVIVTTAEVLGELPDFFAAQDALGKLLERKKHTAGELVSRQAPGAGPTRHHRDCVRGQVHTGVCENALGISLLVGPDPDR